MQLRVHAPQVFPHFVVGPCNAGAATWFHSRHGRIPQGRQKHLSLHDVVQNMAMFARGPKSMCYYTVLREELDVKRTFARFALRSVCAVMLYSFLDKDHSSSLDTQEMFEVLREVFGNSVVGPELVALTDYLMTTVAKQQGTQVCFPCGLVVHILSYLFQASDSRRRLLCSRMCTVRSCLGLILSARPPKAGELRSTQFIVPGGVLLVFYVGWAMHDLGHPSQVP
jgi:hypothetical protein